MKWPIPCGAEPFDHGVRFTFFCRSAERLWLMLFDAADAETPDLEIELDPKQHRFGDIWQIEVEDARAGQFYLYRRDEKQWLLDPYARSVAGSPIWGDPNGVEAGHPPRRGARFPKGLIVADDFDWEDDQSPRVPMEDSIIYELHLRGFTIKAPVDAPGTYRGLKEKIPYLKDLGVTAIELLPIHEFNEMEFHVLNDDRVHLRNLWGYNTIAFFAPNRRYADNDPVVEFKELVKALHQAGIEVILDVVFNHTGEGKEDGPVYSFKGIDRSIYYMENREGAFRNFTGCGNTFNCNHPVVQELILDGLRYWVLEMRVDGFRFDLASVLTRDTDGHVLNRRSLVDRIGEDPILREVKLIAEPWDPGGLYQVGTFPHTDWSEWNALFRDDIRRYWLGHGDLRRLASRLVGSPDLYDKSGQPTAKSINFVTCHDGFTLRDLVSYDHKHNEANAEGNRDGESHNNSWNHGHEGPTDDPAIEALRLKQIKNFLTTLLLAQGVPMVLAGDEIGRTQQGNNNAYCQDNEISWLDWDRLESHAGLLQFVKKLIAFRKAQPTLRQSRFPDSHAAPGALPAIRWFGPNGEAPHWDAGRSLGLLMYGDTDILAIFHAADEDVRWPLPGPRGGPWHETIMTRTNPSSFQPGSPDIHIEARSVTVLTSAAP
ncbi:MAG: glycogen debranching protein GlgX [Verrucomicrobiota bacterium]